MHTVREALEKINIRGRLSFDEPMERHTSFRIGGPADAYAAPEDARSLSLLLDAARNEGHGCFILGGGSNILVSDSGIRGLVVDMSAFGGIELGGAGVRAGAGALSDSLCRFCLDHSLSGLEFLSGLPGRVGGGLFMNARCYGREMADVVSRVDVLDGDVPRSVPLESGQWGYKKSPFQPGGAYEGAVILGAEFSASPGDPQAIFREMEEKRLDRTSKGHYLYPCAGSVFKNDRSFGEPTGAILDKLGFRGKRLGSAAVADFHANIFVNPGKATAADMKALIELAEETAYRERGIRLEREVLLIGDFDEAR